MERIEKERGDFLLVLLLILLAGVGMALLFSSSYSFSERSYGSPFALIKRQFFYLAVGAVAGVLASFTPLEVLRRSLPVILAVTLVVGLLPFIPGFGLQVLGSRRWISVFGRSFQPSELMKLTLVLYLASYFTREERARTLSGLIPPFIVTCIFTTIVYLQNDYSTAVFVLAVALAMFFYAGVRIGHFILLGLFTLPASFFLLFAREHRVRRLLAFLDTAADKAGSAYQVANSQSAFVAGGFLGKGLGRSQAKLGSLPMSHSDFVYAIIGEETGFLGAMFVLVLFALFTWRGFQIALRSTDRFRSALAFGITMTIALQAVLNMAVTVGLVPTTGVTLPFFSAGGSSLAVTLAMCGLLLNVSRGEGKPASRPETRPSGKGRISDVV